MLVMFLRRPLCQLGRTARVLRSRCSSIVPCAFVYVARRLFAVFPHRPLRTIGVHRVPRAHGVPAQSFAYGRRAPFMQLLRAQSALCVRHYNIGNRAQSTSIELN